MENEIEINFLPNSFAVKEDIKKLKGAKFRFGQWQIPFSSATELAEMLISKGGQTAESGKGFADGLAGVRNESTPWAKAGNIVGLGAREEAE